MNKQIIKRFHFDKLSKKFYLKFININKTLHNSKLKN